MTPGPNPSALPVPVRSEPFCLPSVPVPPSVPSREGSDR